MRLDYDLNVGALYISLSDHDVAKTRALDDNTCVDLDADGAVVGIEVIAIHYPCALDKVLRDYPIAPVEAAQLRAYFRRSVPGAGPSASQVSKWHEAPALSIAPVGAAA